MSEKDYKVRAGHCDYRASDEEVYDALRRVTDPLSRSWEKIEKAKKIVIKFNMMKPDTVYFKGRRQELVDDAVCRAVLRLLREHTSAQLVATDTYARKPHRTPPGFNYESYLKEYGVEFVDSNLPPFKEYEVPGGGLMFKRYTLSACFDDADEVVSVAKMKNHIFMGVTLCTKNLFGLPPMLLPQGRARNYFHHVIRLSYVLPDLALITQPCLNIIDALTGQWGREWGGEGRICNALIAGDHPISTDACGMYLMGHDPKSDWPTPPFKHERSHILVAAENGFGTVNLDEIDFSSEVQSPLADFDSIRSDPPELVSSLRRTACEQGLIYLENRKSLVDRYAGNFIYMQDGDVVWSGSDPEVLGSRREVSGEKVESSLAKLSEKKSDSALWLKLVDPEEHEGEQFNVYEKSLSKMAA